jgi:hypothetical protein
MLISALRPGRGWRLRIERGIVSKRMPLPHPFVTPPEGTPPSSMNSLRDLSSGRRFRSWFYELQIPKGTNLGRIVPWRAVTLHRSLTSCTQKTGFGFPCWKNEEGGRVFLNKLHIFRNIRQKNVPVLAHKFLNFINLMLYQYKLYSLKWTNTPKYIEFFFDITTKKYRMPVIKMSNIK